MSDDEIIAELKAVKAKCDAVIARLENGDAALARHAEMTETDHHSAETVFTAQPWPVEPPGKLTRAEVGIDEALGLVGEFQRECRASKVQPLTEIEPSLSDSLEFAAAQLGVIAEHLEKVSHPDDMRLLRAALLVEELGEVLAAMRDRDEVETLDGLADLLYVALGTAVAFDLPLGAAFAEVHLSNMTKRPQADGGMRVKEKGEGYVPPDLARVLSEHRARQKQRVLRAGCGDAALVDLDGRGHATGANPCAGLRELLQEPPDPLEDYGTAPNRHSPHLMGEVLGAAACVHCGMTERDVLAQRRELGRPKCTGVKGLR